MPPVPPKITSMFIFLYLFTILGNGDPAVNAPAVEANPLIVMNLSITTLNLSRFVKFIAESNDTVDNTSDTCGVVAFVCES